MARRTAKNPARSASETRDLIESSRLESRSRTFAAVLSPEDVRTSKNVREFREQPASQLTTLPLESLLASSSALSDEGARNDRQLREPPQDETVAVAPVQFLHGNRKAQLREAPQ